MPSTNVARPADALAVANRYSRRERPLSVLVAVAVATTFLVALLATSLWPAVVVAALLVVLVRAPVLRSHGSIRLRTDADPETVVEAFAGPTPPVLALQWGVADEVSSRERGATYHFTYLLGLRSAEMTVDARREESTDGTRDSDGTHVTDGTDAPDGTYGTDDRDGRHRVVLDVETNDRPWATYTVTIGRDGGQTTTGGDEPTSVDVEYESNRRFGLRRLPQRYVATRFYDDALRAQGYEVVERDRHFGL